MTCRSLAALLLFIAPFGCQNGVSSCFGAGTRIATPSGDVAIEDLRIGHQVLAFDEQSGAVVVSTVTAVFRHEQGLPGLLTLDDGRVLRVTAEHPIYSQTTRSYRPAAELQVADDLLRLLPSDAGPARPHSAQLEPTRLGQPWAPLPDAETVYNIAVATHENYFADGLLVHNKSPTPSGLYSLPDCTEGQLLASAADRMLYCTDVVSTSLVVPDCSAVPNSGLNAYDGILQCMPKGDGSTNTSLKAAIDSIKRQTDMLEAIIASASKTGYCGQYTLNPNPSGAIEGRNGVTGVAGAAHLCRSVAGCGDGAHMCTVYEMYESAAANALPATLSQSWVHMLSWQHNNPLQVPTANGLADNCAGWTYALDDKFWYGTTVEWKKAPSGSMALHVASGPGVVPCSSRFPIACCL